MHQKIHILRFIILGRRSQEGAQNLHPSTVNDIHSQNENYSTALNPSMKVKENINDSKYKHRRERKTSGNGTMLRFRHGEVLAMKGKAARCDIFLFGFLEANFPYWKSNTPPLPQIK